MSPSSSVKLPLIVVTESSPPHSSSQEGLSVPGVVRFGGRLARPEPVPDQGPGPSSLVTARTCTS